MEDEGILTVRQATLEDWPAIEELVPDLVAFGPPPWRDSKQMTRADLDVIHGATTQMDSQGDAVVFVGTIGDHVVAFLHARATVDYYTRSAQGHVADIVVAERARGSGIGAQLLQEAESWARQRGFQYLTIAVFEANAGPLRLYERYGFNREIIRLIKPL